MDMDFIMVAILVFFFKIFGSTTADENQIYDFGRSERNLPHFYSRQRMQLHDVANVDLVSQANSDTKTTKTSIIFAILFNTNLVLWSNE